MTRQVRLARYRVRDRHTVDTAHLLGNHDGGGTVVGTPDTADGKAIKQPAEVTGATGDFEFLLVQHARVVEVAGGDDGMIAQAFHGAEPLGVFPVLHEPTGRLGAEVDADAEDEGGDEGGAELETPGNVTGVFDDDVGAEAEEDSYTVLVLM